MSHLKTLFILAASLSLIACGGSSSKSYVGQYSEKPAQEVDLTEDNLSKAIQIKGAQPANVTIPEELEEVKLTLVSRVPVSANSAFILNLSVPETGLVDKQVAGYIIELPDGTQQFVRAGVDAEEEQRQAQATRTIASASSTPQKPAELPARIQPKRQVLATGDREGLTRVVISGWKSTDFNLEQSLDSLSLRIIPLLVNKTVSDIAELSLADIQAADGFDMSMVQELELAVEAVATSAIQFTLTWDAQNDVDLYVLEPEYATNSSKKVYYGRRYSEETLGWLDRDNTQEYGPENITYNYQLPEGEYEVVVNFYSNHGYTQDTNYALVAAIGDQEPKVFEGTFKKSANNYGDMDSRTEDTSNTNEGSHVVYKFTVDADFNSQLSERIATTQYNGLWKVAPVEQDGVENYIRISGNEINVYSTSSNVDCNGGFGYASSYWNTEYLPSGFRVKNDELQVSDAFISAYNSSENNNYSYVYRTMTLIDLSALDECND